MKRRSETEHSTVWDSVSTLLKYKSSLFSGHLYHFMSFWIQTLKTKTVKETKCSVCNLPFLLLCFTMKCVFPLICTGVLRLSTSVVIYFLDQAVPGLSPAHWSWAIWNLCLFALGTVPSIQSHCGGLKPSSSALNNERSSNVLTPALTHRPSCFSAPACINRSVYSGVRTSFLWSPL